MKPMGFLGRREAIRAPTEADDTIAERKVKFIPLRGCVAYADLRRFTEMPKGGHFAAMEEPEQLAEDIRSFFRPLR
jgi:pimeloyl-ACP methyl ester carboxylesterase